MKDTDYNYLSNYISCEDTFTIRMSKAIARVTLCGGITFTITDNMSWTEPTPEQIKNLHDMFCIDVEILEGGAE